MMKARKGDHICYITNMRRFRSHYSNWELTRSSDAILRELIGATRKRVILEVSIRSGTC